MIKLQKTNKHEVKVEKYKKVFEKLHLLKAYKTKEISNQRIIIFTEYVSGKKELLVIY